MCKRCKITEIVEEKMRGGEGMDNGWAREGKWVWSGM